MRKEKNYYICNIQNKNLPYYFEITTSDAKERFNISCKRLQWYMPKKKESRPYEMPVIFYDEYNDQYFYITDDPDDYFIGDLDYCYSRKHQKFVQVPD